MGGENVLEDAGSRICSESGIYIEFFCNGRDKDTGFSGNLPILGRDRKKRRPFLSMAGVNGKAGTRNTWNCSNVFRNGRPS